MEVVPRHTEPVWQASLHDPVAFATVLLVVVTAGLWICTFLLWRATVRLAKEAKQGAEDQAKKMERSILAANKAAKAAADQVKVAEDTARRELRAYVCLQPLVMEEIQLGPQPLLITIPIENTGSTPANKLIFKWACQVSPNEPTSQFYQELVARYPVVGDRDYSIGPRQIKQIPLEVPITAVNDHWRAKVLSGEMKFYLAGSIQYFDVWGTEHITEFFCHYTTTLTNRLGQVNVHNKIE